EAHGLLCSKAATVRSATFSTRSLEVLSIFLPNATVFTPRRVVDSLFAVISSTRRGRFKRQKRTLHKTRWQALMDSSYRPLRLCSIFLSARMLSSGRRECLLESALTSRQFVTR